jgi:hypothetical protein
MAPRRQTADNHAWCASGHRLLDNPRLNPAFLQLAQHPAGDFIGRSTAFGMRPVGGTPAQMDRFTREQIAKWAKW